MRTASLFTILALAASTFAQSSTSASAPTSKAVSKTSSSASAPSSSGSGVPGISACATGCLIAAAANSTCVSFTNVACACTDLNFQAMAASCLSLECKPAEMQAALQLQQTECGPLSLTPTGSATATAPFVPSNSASDISASGANPGSSPSAGAGGGNSTNTGAAAGLSPFGAGNGVLVSALLALVGGLVGAIAVL